jgi:glycosyltransferase involved in cell wall biosynthesis
MLPLLPQAAEQFDFSAYDLIISSSSGFAKGIITRSTIPHICYCHTPTRYLWDASHEVAGRTGRGSKRILTMLQHYLRMVDFAAAQRPDILIANSKYTQSRIETYYRRSSTVIYPPIDTSLFTPKPSERLNISQAPFLLVGRLTPSKYFDQAINVCEKLQLPLIVVGAGRELPRLKKLAGRFTRFVGKVSNDELRMHYRQARALLQPGIEDFGMASAEALACGTPVIAFGEGGVREIVDHRKHGIVYTEQLPESMAEAIRQFFDHEYTFTPEILQQRALLFSRNRFTQAMTNMVEETLKKRENRERTPAKERQHTASSTSADSLPLTHHS